MNTSFMAKAAHTNKKSITVKQMVHMLSQMPEELEGWSKLLIESGLI